jgi:lipopolysaccharide/colanic/teichoic acid biosynthesis glycosyltransferase
LIKRAFDFTAALVGLLLLSPVLLVVAAIIKLTSAGPVFFRQERMGRDFRPFRIYKFRSMVVNAPQLGGAITAGASDPRITKIGHIIRKTKIDELPQLINVLVGDMSLVGPRPEVPKYVEMFRDEYADVLRVRPGITDYASIKYRDEAALLGTGENTEQIYVERILPDKIALAKQYVHDQSLGLDLRLIWQTVFARD